MEVIKYLENASKAQHDMGSEVGFGISPLTMLNDELGIKCSVSEMYPRLVVLNYCQISSPKYHPITLECRSLVLEIPEEGGSEWKLVSRSFDRFFNHGETDSGYNMDSLVAHEKLDGSLIGLFYYDGEWLYRTKSMIMPTSSIIGEGLTWKDLIEGQLGEGWYKGYSLNKEATFILEVTSPENRIVTRYTDRRLTLLSARHITGMYYPDNFLDSLSIMVGWGRPRRYTFSSMNECIESARNLKDLKEGYVIYDQYNEPVCKVKSPTYICAHHMRGEDGLTPKRICNLVITGETAEYLSVFEEDSDAIQPYIDAYNAIIMDTSSLWSKHCAIVNNKEFAAAVIDSPVSNILFKMRQGKSVSEAFNTFNDIYKRSLILKYLNS